MSEMKERKITPLQLEVKEVEQRHPSDFGPMIPTRSSAAQASQVG